MADHQAFAAMLLRQIVGAHRALLEAEAGRGPDCEDAVQAARERLRQLVQQASVQFPSPFVQPAGPAIPIARH